MPRFGRVVSRVQNILKVFRVTSQGMGTIETVPISPMEDSTQLKEVETGQIVCLCKYDNGEVRVDEVYPRHAHFPNPVPELPPDLHPGGYYG